MLIWEEVQAWPISGLFSLYYASTYNDSIKNVQEYIPFCLHLIYAVI